VSDLSTLRDIKDRVNSRAVWGRRAGIALLLVIVIVAATGALGVHARTVTTRSNGYTLSVTYPQSARAGLDVPWRATVHHEGGFSDDVTIAVSSNYFRMFETQGFYPDADSESNDGKFVYFTFDKPDGDTFVLEYDAYIQPGSQIGKSATVKVSVGDQEVASTSLRTWLVP